MKKFIGWTIIAVMAFFVITNVNLKLDTPVGTVTTNAPKTPAIVYPKGQAAQPQVGYVKSDGTVVTYDKPQTPDTIAPVPTDRVAIAQAEVVVTPEPQAVAALKGEPVPEIKLTQAQKSAITKPLVVAATAAAIAPTVATRDFTSYCKDGKIKWEPSATGGTRIYGLNEKDGLWHYTDDSRSVNSCDQVVALGGMLVSGYIPGLGTVAQ